MEVAGPLGTPLGLAQRAGGFLAESIGQCKYLAAPVEPGSGYSQGSQAFSRDHSPYYSTEKKQETITGGWE